MKKLIEKFSGLVKSSPSGFYHIVFKGITLPFMSVNKVMDFCKAQCILNKGYKVWMLPRRGA